MPRSSSLASSLLLSLISTTSGSGARKRGRKGRLFHCLSRSIRKKLCMLRRIRKISEMVRQVPHQLGRHLAKQLAAEVYSEVDRASLRRCKAMKLVLNDALDDVNR